jgi:nucleotide-binding universal stress UspA family protein
MKQYERILVGLKTLDHVDELTYLACRLSSPSASLRLVHVIELPDPTPLDANVPDLDSAANEIIEKAEAIVHLSGMKVSTAVLRAHGAAYALIDELEQYKIELAVLGYHHRRSIGEFLLGTTAERMARHAPCRIVLSIPARA